MVHAPVTLIAISVTEAQGAHIAQGRGAALPAEHTWKPSVHATAVGLVEPAGQKKPAVQGPLHAGVVR